jgi:hypothetical protein
VTRIEATIPCLTPPAWAVWERKLLDVMSQSVHPFLAKYTHEDGTLIFRDEFHSRDGADDFYESFYNWPLLYLLGGGDDLLPLAHRQWEATTRLLTKYGNVYKEYERGYDQFHQAESYIYFYLLCLADPTNPLLAERAQRFAGFYLNEDPDAPNYDATLKIIRSPHNGSGGPIPTMGDNPSYGYWPSMARYGLPFEDVPGITRYEDLKDPVLARRMGEVMRDRMAWGDVPANLGATSLVTNAWLLTGQDKYVAWVQEYVDAWMERARANGGLLPDNVGLSGQVGETMRGKWYGGQYGWTWPHGFYNIGMSAAVAGGNAFLMTRDARYLDLPRWQIDGVMAHAEMRDLETLEMSLEKHWIGMFAGQGGKKARAFVVPYRYRDSGWFDYNPMSPVYPLAVWNVSMADEDWQRVERVRETSGYDWRKVFSFRTKEDNGHEQPWQRFLVGDNPTYPEQILAASYDQVCRRLEQIRQDQADINKVHIHHWQTLNPVVTEALIQLTLGAPQILYNGGLLHARLRYFDVQRQRPGLPQDVAALVEKLEAVRTVVRLVNLNPSESREVLLQAGAFGEHQFVNARYAARSSEYPGPIGTYAAPGLQITEQVVSVGAKHLMVALPPASEIVLDLETTRYVNTPSYALPW